MNALRKRRLAAVAGAGLLAAAGVVAPMTAAHAAVACDVVYATNDWPGGFTANVTLRNLGDPLTGWTLGFTFPDASQRRAAGLVGHLDPVRQRGHRPQPRLERQPRHRRLDLDRLQRRVESAATPSRPRSPSTASAAAARRPPTPRPPSR